MTHIQGTGLCESQPHFSHLRLGIVQNYNRVYALHYEAVLTQKGRVLVTYRFSCLTERDFHISGDVLSYRAFSSGYSFTTGSCVRAIGGSCRTSVLYGGAASRMEEALAGDMLIRRSISPFMILGSIPYTSFEGLETPTVLWSSLTSTIGAERTCGTLGDAPVGDSTGLAGGGGEYRRPGSRCFLSTGCELEKGAVCLDFVGAPPGDDGSIYGSISSPGRCCL